VVALYRSVAAFPIGLCILYYDGIGGMKWPALVWAVLGGMGGWMSWYTYTWIMSKQPAPKVTAMLYFKVRWTTPARSPWLYGETPPASDAESLLGDAKSSPGDAKSSLGDAKSSLGDTKSSPGDAKSSLGDAKSSLGDAKSSLGDAESSLGDAESSLGDMLRARWVR
jgi:hypothetical protein